MYAAEGGHLEDAAEDGNLEVLKWLHANECPWDESVCMNDAAIGGHLEVLKWLRANGCPWSGGGFPTALQAAEQGGHDHIVVWARANGCPEAMQ